MKLSLKDVLALFIGLAALVGLGVMLMSEPVVNAGLNLATYTSQVLPGLKNYAYALGLLLLVVSISYILLGRENDIETKADESSK
jgi:hypothetical protein